MTGNSDLRDKGRAVFLAAIMVLSMVAMSATFAGAAAAAEHDIDVSTGDAEGDFEDTVEVSFEIEASDASDVSEVGEGHEVNIEYDETVVEPVLEADESFFAEAGGADSPDSVEYLVGDDPNDGTLTFSALETSSIPLPITTEDGVGESLEFEIVTEDEDVTTDLTTSVTLDEDEGGQFVVEYDQGQITANAPQPATGELTFNDQALADDGTVTVSDVSTGQESTVAVTYEDGEENTIAGLAAADNLDNEDVSVEIEDDGGFPGEHTAWVFDNEDVPEGTGVGDDATPIAGDALDSDTADVTEEEDDEEEEETDFDTSVEFGEEDPRYWEGQIVRVTGFGAGEDVDVHEFDDDDDRGLGSLVRERTANDEGNLILDTAGLEDNEDYILATEDDEGNDFTILVQDIEVFDIGADQVRLGSATDLSIQSDRRNFDIEITETQQDLDADTVASLFDEDVVEETTDDGAVLSLTGSEGTFDMSVPAGLATGNYTFEGDVTDTTASGSDDVEFLEEGDLFVDFAQASVSGDRGDNVNFGIEFEGTDQGIIQIEDSGGNYVANLSVAANDDGEATIQWNSFAAAQGEPMDAFTAVEGDLLDAEETLDLTEGDRTASRILEDDYDLASYIESTDDLGEVDIEELDEDNVATIFLSDVDERAVSAQSWVAPSGSIDVDDDEVDDILDVVSQDSTVANEDFVVLEFGAEGVFGYLTDDDGNVNAGQGLSVTVAEPDQAYDEGDTFTSADDGIDFVPNAAGNNMFLVIDTDEVDDLAADINYNAAFTIVGEDNDYIDDDEVVEQVDTSFTIEERNVDVTGVFDDEDRLEVPAGETELTAQTNLAPGSEIFMRARASSPAPFLEDTTVEVDEDGLATAEFDFSDRDVGVEFTTTARDVLGDEEDAVASVFVADDADEDPEAFFGVSNLEPASANVDPGDEVTVTATVTNEGDAADTQDIEFALDGDVQDSIEEELEPGDSVDVEFTIDAPDVEETTAFEHAVQTDDDSEIGTLTVEVPEPDDDDEPPADDDEDDADDEVPDDDDDDDEEDDGAPGFGIAVALLAILGAALLAVRRQN